MEVEDIDFVRAFRHIRNEHGIGDIVGNDAMFLIRQYLIDNHTAEANEYKPLSQKAFNMMVEIGMLQKVVVNKKGTHKYRLIDIHGV